jgi:hypothetical protein
MSTPETNFNEQISPKEFDFWKSVTIALLIVLCVGFAAVFLQAASMLWTSWTSNQATYEDLKDQVLLQNTKIDALTNAINQSGSISTSTKK